MLILGIQQGDIIITKIKIKNRVTLCRTRIIAPDSKLTGHEGRHPSDDAERW